MTWSMNKGYARYDVLRDLVGELANARSAKLLHEPFGVRVDSVLM